MIENKRYIVAIGLKGFPYGTAPIQKLYLMAKGLVEQGNNVTVVSNGHLKKTPLNESLEKKGKVDGINYFCTAPNVFSPIRLMPKIYNKLYGAVNEIFYLFKLKRQKKLDILIVYSKLFLYSYLIGKLFKLIGCGTYVVYFEFRSKVSVRKKWNQRLNDTLFDNFIFNAFSGVISISKLLALHIEKKAPKKPYIIIPPIVDFELFKTDYNNELPPYFLYCGTIAYFDVIEFIIRSYALIYSKHDIFLYIITSGTETEKKQLYNLVKIMGLESRIKVFSDLTDNDLRKYYLKAKALLIPLRPTIQDQARFPHKIAEYCASRKPIITTRVGEIVEYFDDRSALLADNYDVNEFADKMRFVMENTKEVEIIADNSFKLGKKYFNYKSYQLKLSVFLTKK